MQDNKCIKCDVESCEFNDNNKSYCTLNEIKVSANCNPIKAHKKQTICDSFKDKK